MKEIYKILKSKGDVCHTKVWCAVHVVVSDRTIPSFHVAYR